jgi:hypothetical protein
MMPPEVRFRQVKPKLVDLRDFGTSILRSVG